MTSQELASLIGISLAACITTIWHRIRGDKTATLTNALEGLVQTGIHIAALELGAPENLDRVRVTVTRYVWIGLDKIGIKKGGMVELMVQAAVEQGLAQALAELKAHDRALAIATAAAPTPGPSTPPPTVVVQPVA